MNLPNGISVTLKKTVIPTAMIASLLGFLFWQGVVVIKADRAATASQIKSAEVAAQVATDATREAKVAADLRFQELTARIQFLADQVAAVDRKVDRIGDTLEKLLLRDARIAAGKE